MFTIDKKNQDMTNNTNNIDKNLEVIVNKGHNKNILYKNPKANIIITYAYSPEYFYYGNHTLQLVNNNSINLNKLIEDMSSLYLVNLNNTSISVFDKDLKSYVYCGIYPFSNEVTIPFELEEKEDSYDYPNIQIKSRQIIKKDNMMRMELNDENPELTDENNQNVFINNKSKRSKERKIGYIIEKVFLWRKLYNGFIDDNGELRKLTLEEAAEKVGISKKSLDDYLIQLRIGRQHGFIFNEHKNDKVGVLRAFVKKQKFEESKGNFLNKFSQGFNPNSNITFHGTNTDY